jgi:hypothetical protein
MFCVGTMYAIYISVTIIYKAVDGSTRRGECAGARKRG